MKRALCMSNRHYIQYILLIQSNKFANASEMQIISSHSFQKKKISSSHNLVSPATTMRPIYSYKLDSMPLTPFLIQLNKDKMKAISSIMVRTRIQQP